MMSFSSFSQLLLVVFSFVGVCLLKVFGASVCWFVWVFMVLVGFLFFFAQMAVAVIYPLETLLLWWISS